MVFRRFRAVIPLVASLLVVGGVFVGVSVATAGPASALPEIKICLTNSSSFCADVKDSVNKSGEPIWLYQPSNGAHDYQWLEASVPCNDLTCLCDQGCVEFEDAQNPNLCLGLSSTSYYMELIGCELTGVNGGTARAAWIRDGHYLVNRFLGAANGGYLAVPGPLYNGDLLGAAYYSGPGGPLWEQWSGP